jgi:outer membrane protein OmpA-like peptidoglycan-associated protein
VGTQDGSVKLNVKGGTPPYKIKWSTGDLNTKQIFGLSAGQYRVTITDSEQNAVDSRIMLMEARPLTIEMDEMLVDELTPSNTSVSFVFEGGSPGYLLDINGINTSNPVKGLTPGTHTAVVTDIMGCKASLEFTIEGETNLSKMDASTIKVGQVLRIDKLYFATDSTNITSTSLPVLNEVYEFLYANQNITIEIGGHTNGLPPHDYCDRLSTERAKNVAQHLIDRGIESSRVSYKGYGKRVPIATNKTVAGRKKNQRVEIKILSVGE